MPSVSDLSPVRVMFASGTADLNRAMLEHFSPLRPELPLCVVAEFEPERGEWIRWHAQRSLEQNLANVRTALAARPIAAAAVAYDRRSALGNLRKAAWILAPDVLTTYDEDMRTASPRAFPVFLTRRAMRGIGAQLGTGGRARSWLRRIVHPSEAEIPIRARLAQARGLTASRARATPRANTPNNATETPSRDIEGREREGAVSPQLPGVTIVIPTRDGLPLLREMLPPLLTQLVQGEVVIIDNGSSDGTADWLAREYPEIRVVRDAAPLSFAAAVNRGIRMAHYSSTLLLNNDMTVEPGFIDALRDAFQRVPDLFCATAQIFFPPGIRRQETGKTVWQRKSDLDFPVRCDDPVEGEDLTWVLYGSGGCSLFDTEKLLAIGGVAELYEPAYVEDMDFGFRAWKRGWPSVLCANARVEHRHRSTTSRFYTDRQIDFFVERNYLRFVANVVSDRALFEKLWLEGIRRLQLQAMHGRGAALDTLRAIPPINYSPPAKTGHLPEAEILALANGDIAVFSGRRKSGRRTVLIASPYLPFPLSHGGAVRIYNLMKLAAETDDLVLLAFVDELTTPPPELLSLCCQIVLVRRHGSHYRRDTERPDMVEEFDSDTFRAALRQTVHQFRPAIVQLEFTWMAQYANACHPAKTILVEHDVTFDLQLQMLDIAPSAGTARVELKQQYKKWHNFETEAWKNVDCVVTMSAQDTRSVQGARSVECIPNGVDCERFQPSDTQPDPHRLLLIGSFAHLPNLLALEFFLRDAWPLLPPGYTLHVIGGARHEYYLDFFRDRVSIDLKQPGIELEGFVEDVRPAYRRAAIVLAPLNASAGTNIKVLEAMAMGKVVVSTPAGVNGLSFTPDHDFLLAETGAQMVSQIELIGNVAERRRQIGENARQAALQFDWRVIGKRQAALYERLTQPGIQ